MAELAIVFLSPEGEIHDSLFGHGTRTHDSMLEHVSVPSNGPAGDVSLAPYPVENGVKVDLCSRVS